MAVERESLNVLVEHEWQKKRIKFSCSEHELTEQQWSFGHETGHWHLGMTGKTSVLHPHAGGPRLTNMAWCWWWCVYSMDVRGEDVFPIDMRKDEGHEGTEAGETSSGMLCSTWFCMWKEDEYRRQWKRISLSGGWCGHQREQSWHWRCVFFCLFCAVVVVAVVVDCISLCVYCEFSTNTSKEYPQCGAAAPVGREKMYFPVLHSIWSSTIASWAKEIRDSQQLGKLDLTGLELSLWPCCAVGLCTVESAGIGFLLQWWHQDQWGQVVPQGILVWK